MPGEEVYESKAYHYAKMEQSLALPAPHGLVLDLVSHVRREVTLMQRILDQERLLGLLTHEIAPEMRAPGTWMHDALQLRDQWESKLLRTSSWSPLH